MLKLVCIGFALLLRLTSFTQINHDWWHAKHDIGTLPHWSNVIEISAGLMGPNALPVPEINTVLLNQQMSFSIGAASHFGSGDQTNNLDLEVFIPFKGEQVALKMWMVPIEYFKMDTITRDLRKARELDGEGFGVGDLYIGTLIQLMKGRKLLPDILLSINLKTASGSNLGAARFTNAPGYFMDLSFAKNFLINSDSTCFLRAVLLGGFYVYQTNRTDYFQNDALLYGTSLEIHLNELILRPSFRGYYGYINNGDKPLVFRLDLEKSLSEKVKLQVFFQEGLSDFPYRSIGASLSFNWTRKPGL